MARIRTIKPDFWKHEDLSELPPETHMLAAALLNYSDDEGYFKANPKLVKADCCPLREDSSNIRRSLDDLSNIGYIKLFTGTDGKEYGQVIKFLEHQRVDRAKPSTIKKLEDSTKDRRKIDEPSTPEGKGREGKGIEPTSAKKPTCPTEKIIELFKTKCTSLVQPRIVTDATKGMIADRWRQDEKHQDLAFWEKYFDYCESLDFLAGRTSPNPNRSEKPFRVGLEWIVKSANFAKIINGNYANA